MMNTRFTRIFAHLMVVLVVMCGCTNVQANTQTDTADISNSETTAPKSAVELVEACLEKQVSLDTSRDNLVKYNQVYYLISATNGKTYLITEVNCPDCIFLYGKNGQKAIKAKKMLAPVMNEHDFTLDFSCIENSNSADAFAWQTTKGKSYFVLLNPELGEEDECSQIYTYNADTNVLALYWDININS